MDEAKASQAPTVDDALAAGTAPAELVEAFGSGDMVRAAAANVGYRQPDTDPKLDAEITSESPQE